MTSGFSSAPRFRLQLTPANLKVMFDGIKQALGPTQKKTAPLKSATGEVIQDREQQMERWAEHYTELYAKENVVIEDALNAIECLPELEELDREPTIDELSEALDSLASGKAPGKDGIPIEVLKCCKETLITELHKILCLRWSEGEVPQDMRNANAVTMYKNKDVMGAGIAQLVVHGLAVHGVAGSILLWGHFPVEGIFPLELTWVQTPFPQKLLRMRV